MSVAWSPSPARPLSEIAADALQAECGHCWPGPGNDCKGGEGLHLARFARARRRGLLDGPDMCVVLDAVAPGPADVFTPGTVVPGTAPAVTS